MGIQDLVKQTREQHGLTQQQMSDRLECSQVFVCQIERGDRTPSRFWIKRFADEFGLDADELELMCGRITAKMRRRLLDDKQ